MKANGHGSRSPKAAPKQPGGDFGVRTCSAGEARAGTSLHTQLHSSSRGGEAAWHQQGCGRTSSPSPSIKSWDIWAGRKQRGEKKINHTATKMQLTPVLRMKPLVEKGTTTNTLPQSSALRHRATPPTEHHFKSIHVESAADRTFVFRCSELFKPQASTTTDGHNSKIHHICAQIIFSLWLL